MLGSIGASPTLVDTAVGTNGLRSVRVDVTRQWPESPPTPRVTEVAWQFGLTRAPTEARIVEPLDVRLGPGRIVLLLGPSGSGKSTALHCIESQCPGAHNVRRMSMPRDRCLVDVVRPQSDLRDALLLLVSCALGEVPLWMRRYDELSEGEQFRARLARAIGLHTRAPSVAPLFCDEFCCGLHRRAAKAIAYNLRKLATRLGLCLVLASSNEDIVADLQPDALVRLLGGGRYTLDQRVPRRRPISLARRLHIEPGRKADYAAFAAMHYRSSDEVGFVDRVFLLREGLGGVPLGIVVYGHGPMELALRNQATGGRFVRRPDRLNRELRILKRLVIHPDIRGCGQGQLLVRKTLPRVGTPYVECLASMGDLNPVFEKAGMQRIDRYPLPQVPAAALNRLREWDVDPGTRDFELQVGRRPRVRRVVAEAVASWYRATTGGGENRVAGQSARALAQLFRGLIGSRPVYYLWKRNK